jgi:hypothetical protein
MLDARGDRAGRGPKCFRWALSGAAPFFAMILDCANQEPDHGVTVAPVSSSAKDRIPKSGCSDRAVGALATKSSAPRSEEFHCQRSHLWGARRVWRGRLTEGIYGARIGLSHLCDCRSSSSSASDLGERQVSLVAANVDLSPACSRRRAPQIRRPRQLSGRSSLSALE